jgi:hypothetical protein
MRRLRTSDFRRRSAAQFGRLFSELRRRLDQGRGRLRRPSRACPGWLAGVPIPGSLSRLVRTPNFVGGWEVSGGRSSSASAPPPCESGPSAAPADWLPHVPEPFLPKLVSFCCGGHALHPCHAGPSSRPGVGRRATRMSRRAICCRLAEVRRCRISLRSYSLRETREGNTVPTCSLRAFSGGRNVAGITRSSVDICRGMHITRSLRLASGCASAC